MNHFVKKFKRAISVASKIEFCNEVLPKFENRNWHLWPWFHTVDNVIYRLPGATFLIMKEASI